INIHDVQLAKQFVDRVVGLNAGCVVFDDKPNLLTEYVLTQIYGEEDWSQQAEEEADDLIITSPRLSEATI
ncbi:phosphonate ABC transporter ATP-binding protein, partial [Vibrio sp. 10N.222.55.C6]